MPAHPDSPQRTPNILKIQHEGSNKCNALVTANPCSYESQYIKIYDILSLWENTVRNSKKNNHLNIKFNYGSMYFEGIIQYLLALYLYFK